MTSTAIVHSPKTLAETYQILAERAEAIKILGGGTDLMVLMNARTLDCKEFLDIWRVDELRGITEEGSDLRIGALTTYTQLIQSDLIKEYVPSLVSASRTIGALQIQNRGTLGGNIVNASPAGDSLPVLAAFDAMIEIGSIRGNRTVPFTQFYTGYRRTVLEKDELVRGVTIRKLASEDCDFFYKVGTRRAQAISKVVMGVKTRSADGVIDSIKIGLGSVAPTVIRALDTESFLAGQEITPELIDQARQVIVREVKPITDVRSTEYYRREVTSNLLARLLRLLGPSG
jgi:CO/xanthine dehydrogenase FAD-binding subunit